jgi:hypothetical protein
MEYEFSFDPLIFHEGMALGLRKNITTYQSVFRNFFSLLTDIPLILPLLCHTKSQMKFEFDFDPLIFPEVMALGLRKIYIFIIYLVVIMHHLHGVILATSQLPISARGEKMHINISTRAKNAYQ